MVRFVNEVIIENQANGSAALTVEGWTSFRDRIEALASFSAASMSVSDFSVGGLSHMNGGISLASPDVTTRPPLLPVPTVGEIGARSATDAGFLRLSAGGSSDPALQSFIDVSADHTDPDMHGVISLGTLGAERLRLTGAASTFSGPVVMQGLTSTSGMFTQEITAGNGLKVTGGETSLLTATMTGMLTGTSATFSSSMVDGNTLTIKNTSSGGTSFSQVSVLADNAAGGLNLWLNSTTRTTGGPPNGATLQNDVGQLRLGVKYGGSNYLTISNALTTFDKAVTIEGAVTANTGLNVNGSLTVAAGGQTTLLTTSTGALTATSLTVNGSGTLTSAATALTLTSTTAGNNTPSITLNNSAGGTGNTVSLTMSPFSARAGGPSTRIVAIDDGSSGAYLSLRVAGGSAAATMSEQLRITSAQTSVFGDLTVAKTVMWGTTPAPAAPTTTTRSTGTRVVLFPGLAANAVDYAIGIDGNTRWDSIPTNTSVFSFKWFGGTVPVMTLKGDGDFTISGDVSAKKSLSVGGNYYYQYNTSDAANPVYSVFSARDNLRVFWDMWNNGTNDISTSANGNMTMRKGTGTWDIASSSGVAVGGTISSMPVRMSMSLATGLVTFNNGITSTGGATTLGATTTGNLTFASVTNPASNTPISTSSGAAGWNSFSLNNEVGSPISYFGIGNSGSPLPYRGNFYVQSAGNIVLNPGSVSGARVFDLSSAGLSLSAGATFGGDVTVNGTNLNANQVRFPANASGLQWGSASSPISRIYDDEQLHIWTNDNMYFDVGGAGAATGSITWSTNVFHLTSTAATLKVPLTVTSASTDASAPALKVELSGSNFCVYRSGATDTVVQNTGGGSLLLSNNVVISGSGNFSNDITLASTVPRLVFNASSFAAPSFTTRSVGTKILLWPQLSASNVDYAIGIESYSMWQSVPGTNFAFNWYGGTTNVMKLTGTGVLTLLGDQVATQPYVTAGLATKQNTVNWEALGVIKSVGIHVGYDAPNEQGLFIRWNRSGRLGETNFQNQVGEGGGANYGGFRFENWSKSNQWVNEMSFSHAGLLTVPSVLVSAGATFSGDVVVNGTNLDAKQVRFASNGSGLQWGSGPFSRIYDNADLHIWSDDNIYVDISGTANTSGGTTGATNVLHLTATSANLKVPFALPLTVNSPATSSTTLGSFFTPSLASGASSNVSIQVGVSATNLNDAYWNFQYLGSGNLGNITNIGLWGGACKLSIGSNVASITSTATTNMNLLNVFQASLEAGKYTEILHGVSATNGNAAAIDFNYAGDGSINNALSLGFYGNNGIVKVLHDGTTQFRRGFFGYGSGGQAFSAFGNANASVLNVQSATHNGGPTPAAAEPVLNLLRAGVNDQSWGNSATFLLSRYEHPTDLASRTQLDISLAHGTLNLGQAAYTNVLRLRSDGSATVAGNLTAGNVYGNLFNTSELTVRGSAAEGGQINLGFRANTSILGQGANSWVIDVDENNALRVFNINASSVATTAMSIGTAGNITIASNLTVNAGMTVPSGTFSVLGSVRTGLETGVNYIQSGDAARTANSWIPLVFSRYMSETSIMRLESTGLTVAGSMNVGSKAYVKGDGTGGTVQIAPLTAGAEASIGFFGPTNFTAAANGDQWTLGRNSWGQTGGTFALGCSPGLGACLTVAPTSGDVKIFSTSNANSTVSGALQVGGGVGIGNRLWVGGDVVSGSNFYGKTTGFALFTNATNKGLSVNASGDVTLNSATSSNSTGTGALQVAGGAGIGGALHAVSINATAGTFSGAVAVGTIGYAIRPDAVDIGDLAVDARWRLQNGNYRLNFLKSNSSGVFETLSYISQTGAFTGPVAASTLTATSGTFSGNLTAAGDVTGGVFRAGNSGFYFQNLGGGFYMDEGTTVKTHGNKNISTGGQLQSGSVSTSGDVALTGSTPRIMMGSNKTTGPPSTTSRSLGTRLALWEDAGNVDYAFGINSGTLWSSVPSGQAFRWYNGATEVMTLTGSTLSMGALSATTGKFGVVNISYGLPYEQGTYIRWNRSNGHGETNFQNQLGQGALGGFAFENWSNTNQFVNEMRFTHQGVLTVPGDVNAASFRAGDNGFFFPNRGGGFYMDDGNTVKTHGNKNVYTGGQLQANSIISYGDLTVNGTAYLNGTTRMLIDRWHISSEGANRFNFVNNGRTEYGSKNGYAWYNATNGGILILENSGTLKMKAGASSRIEFDNGGNGIAWGSGNNGPYSRIYEDGQLHIWTDDNIFFDVGGTTGWEGGTANHVSALQLTRTSATFNVPVTMGALTATSGAFTTSLSIGGAAVATQTWITNQSYATNIYVNGELAKKQNSITASTPLTMGALTVSSLSIGQTTLDDYIVARSSSFTTGTGLTLSTSKVLSLDTTQTLQNLTVTGMTTLGNNVSTTTTYQNLVYPPPMYNSWNPMSTTTGSANTIDYDGPYGSGTYGYTDNVGGPSGSLQSWEGVTGNYGAATVFQNYDTYGTYYGSTTTSASGTTLYGEWIQVNLPNDINFVEYKYTGDLTVALVGSAQFGPWTLLAQNIAGSTSWRAATAGTFRNFRFVLTKGRYGGGNNYIRYVSLRTGPGSYTTMNTVLDVRGAMTVSSIKKTAGSFEIKHPDPTKGDRGMVLRHCFVESPTRGDNIYRFTIAITGGEGEIKLPDYFPFLNENVQTWVSARESYARAFVRVDNSANRLLVVAEEDGIFDVLVIGTRKDELAKAFFDPQGVEYLADP